MTRIRVIPVMDLKDGQVVHAVAGRRKEYRPITSKLVKSANPLDVAQAFRNELNLNEIYLADLDAIAGREPAWSVYLALHERGFQLLVDPGIKTEQTAREVRDAGVHQVIVGLETLPDPTTLRRILEMLGAEHTVFSLDMIADQPLGNLDPWKSDDPMHIALLALNMGVRNLIVLDLAYIGAGQGMNTRLLSKINELRNDLDTLMPDVQIMVGGGISRPADLRKLEQIGVSGALVATALHNGKIRREHISRVRGKQS